MFNDFLQSKKKLTGVNVGTTVIMGYFDSIQICLKSCCGRQYHSSEIGDHHCDSSERFMILDRLSKPRSRANKDTSG